MKVNRIESFIIGVLVGIMLWIALIGVAYVSAPARPDLAAQQIHRASPFGPKIPIENMATVSGRQLWDEYLLRRTCPHSCLHYVPGLTMNMYAHEMYQ